MANSARDVADARTVADAAGIPHETVNLSAAFRENVVEPFVRAYFEGRTPNPCVDCNRTVKFGALLQAARELGCEEIATGHYARVEKDAGGRPLLFRAKDPGKDQSYMLWSLTAEQLSRVRFPLCDLPKSEVRRIAREKGLPVLERPESQDICFVPDGDYAAFLLRQSGVDAVPAGDFVTPDGRVLGRHRGLIHYTVGQRKGLGIALGEPRYVARKCAADNTVTLCRDEELYTATLTASSANFIPFDTPAEPIRLQAKIRYRHEAAPATLTPLGSDRFRLTFDTPQRAPAPGQSVVLYRDDLVLGGGVIE
jgi:tRNA-specific 2-thiouridylase